MSRIFWLFSAVLVSGCCTIEDTASKFWLRHVEKMTNWIQADAEALKYREEEEAAREYLRLLRDLTTVQEVSARLKADGFHWRREALDFTNYPWVTIAKRRGDCDDFMVLWEAALKYKEGRTQKVFVASRTSAHAMLLYTKSGTVWLLSNLDIFAVGIVGQEEEMIRKFYLDSTRKIVIY